jgi:hypothetical protein
MRKALTGGSIAARDATTRPQDVAVVSVSDAAVAWGRNAMVQDVVDWQRRHERRRRGLRRALLARALRRTRPQWLEPPLPTTTCSPCHAMT